MNHTMLHPHEVGFKEKGITGQSYQEGKAWVPSPFLIPNVLESVGHTTWFWVPVDRPSYQGGCFPEGKSKNGHTRG